MLRNIPEERRSHTRNMFLLQYCNTRQNVATQFLTLLTVKVLLSYMPEETHYLYVLREFSETVCETRYQAK